MVKQGYNECEFTTGESIKDKGGKKEVVSEEK